MKRYNAWIKSAESNLLLVKNLINESDSPASSCCFHSREASEKYLKAYLILTSIDINLRTHNLQTIYYLCALSNPIFKTIKSNLFGLKNYNENILYPNDIDDNEPSLSDAQQAYENAIIIKEFILKNFFD